MGENKNFVQITIELILKISLNKISSQEINRLISNKNTQKLRARQISKQFQSLETVLRE